ncbi:WG repeat protein [Flavobacterium sp. 270]|uniref:WG repeat-containing protein n=1 Tax=Flavobacterium sp. 270 TaxID=2512114 RepID=UPI001065D910|nr:WG repeat-containing protein [Flavobacterium sp. 270]TDW47762.1 WG repeat protein [Flavobacterium sp. 270]
MSPEELKSFEERQNEMQQTRDIFDLICSRLNLKYGEFFGFRDTRGFVVLNIYNDKGGKTRVLKVSETAEVLFDTHKYYSVHHTQTKKDILFFSELRDKPEIYKTTREGVLDENFEILVPAIYDTVRDINEDSYLVVIDDYRGILNSKFEIIIPLKYSEIEYNKTLKIFKAREQIHKGKDEDGDDLEGSRYWIYDQNGLLLQTLEYGLVNFVHDPNLYTVYDIGVFYSSYVDNTAMIEQQGLLDQHFSIIIPPLYNLISKGEKFILVYEKRNAVSGHDYESKEAEGAECYYTLDGGKWGVYDHAGSLIISIQYNWIDHTFSDDLFLINPTGLMYYYQGEQEDGVWCAKDGFWGLINSNNEIIVEPVYKHYQMYEDRIIFYNRQTVNYEILDIEDALTIYF